MEIRVNKDKENVINEIRKLVKESCEHYEELQSITYENDIVFLLPVPDQMLAFQCMSKGASSVGML